MYVNKEINNKFSKSETVASMSKKLGPGRLARPSQFLCKNEGKFIIETQRETALIVDLTPI